MTKRNKKRAPRAGGATGRATIGVSVAGLEIARGHDGLLRGKPEPVVVLTALVLGGSAPRVVGRAAVDFRVEAPFPCVARTGAAAVSARASVHERARVVVVAAALERDSGTGVEATFAALAEPAALLAWSPDAAVPEPRALLDLAAQPAVETLAAAPVRLLHAGRDLAEQVDGDDWIGACLGLADVSPPRGAERLRLRFVDAAGRNDWTALVDVSLS